MRRGRDILEGIYGSDKPRPGRRVDWRRVGALFAPYWRSQVLVLVCIALIAFLGLVPGYATARIIDSALPHGDVRELGLAVCVIVVAAICSVGIAVVQGIHVAVVSEGIMRDVRTKLIAHVHRMPLDFFTVTPAGEVMNRVLGDVDNIESTVRGTFTTIITSIFVIATTIAAMFLWNWRLALISAVVVPFMVLPLGPVGRRMYTARKITREQRDEIQAIAQETLSISGITLVKSFGRESFERSRFYDVGTRLMQLEVHLATVGLWLMAVVGAMVIVGPALVWLGGGWLALRGAIDIGVIVAFIGFIQTRLYGPVASLIGVQSQIISGIAVFDRIFEYLDLPAEDYEPPGAVDIGELRGDVCFENVTFGYDADHPILKNVSFHAKAGQVVAFVGVSGAGKSTITKLVPRFYDPQGGRVLVDGYDVRNVTIGSLRRGIGIVTQETYLFHDTIANNLRYAKADATDAELIAAATSANMHEHISAIPGGYDTVVGERGHKLSGGERQRLAIARVLLENPRILILDEATSSLDSRNEAAIQSALDVAMRGRTSLIIAHRLSTVVNADLIVVVENGEIVETGRHEMLLARNGAYAGLYQTQFSKST